jgi:hypothetical protein
LAKLTCAPRYAPFIRLITSIERLRQNDKISNMYRLVKDARYELLVMTDNDVRVGRDDLAFADATLGAATCFYRCVGGGTFAADVAMLGCAPIPSRAR